MTNLRKETDAIAIRLLNLFTVVFIHQEPSHPSPVSVYSLLACFEDAGLVLCVIQASFKGAQRTPNKT